MLVADRDQLAAIVRDTAMARHHQHLPDLDTELLLRLLGERDPELGQFIESETAAFIAGER